MWVVSLLLYLLYSHVCPLSRLNPVSMAEWDELCRNHHLGQKQGIFNWLASWLRWLMRSPICKAPQSFLVQILEMSTSHGYEHPASCICGAEACSRHSTQQAKEPASYYCEHLHPSCQNCASHVLTCLWYNRARKAITERCFPIGSTCCGLARPRCQIFKQAKPLSYFHVKCRKYWSRVRFWGRTQEIDRYVVRTSTICPRHKCMYQIAVFTFKCMMPLVAMRYICRAPRLISTQGAKFTVNDLQNTCASWLLDTKLCVTKTKDMLNL